MQIDMHYYGIYSLARAAGINAETAGIIATASQFVDDAVRKESERLEDGALVICDATGHHSLDAKNLDPEDQRNVWVPFHFMPGNDGAEFTERLLCRKDSAMARSMVDHHFTLSSKPFGRELMGITAHVYADTFSHYGFSGVSSRRNRVHGRSIEVHVKDPAVKKYILDKQERFFKEQGKNGGLHSNIRSQGKLTLRQRLLSFVSGTAEAFSGALGHGGVTTHPDRPYLRWSFEYEQGARRSERDNHATFLEGCEALHGFFSRCADRNPAWADTKSRRMFSDIRKNIAEVLAVEADKAGRIAAWQKAVSGGELFDPVEGLIPVYQGDAWKKDVDGFGDVKNSPDVASFSVYKFYQAASHHRNYVLRDLLPSHGLVVV